MDIKIIRAQTAAQVAEAWKNQYFHAGHWSQTAIGNPRPIYEQLLALRNTRSERKIANVIGNTTWTRITCNNCAANVRKAWDVDGTIICPACVSEANSKLNAPSQNNGP